MKTHARKAAQTYRLVDERQDLAIPGPLSLLMPGTQGGHLLLALPDGARENAQRTPALGLAASRGPADAWRLLTAAGAGQAPLPRRVFCFAFVTDERSLVFYAQTEDDAVGELSD